MCCSTRPFLLEKILKYERTYLYLLSTWSSTWHSPRIWEKFGKVKSTRCDSSVFVGYLNLVKCRFSGGQCGLDNILSWIQEYTCHENMVFVAKKNTHTITITEANKVLPTKHDTKSKSEIKCSLKCGVFVVLRVNWL